MSFCFLAVIIGHLKMNRTESTRSMGMQRVEVAKFKGLIQWLSSGHAHCNKRLV